MPFLKNEDHFLGIELFGSRMRGSLAAVDPHAKHIRIIDQAEVRIDIAPLDAFARFIPQLIKQVRMPPSVRVLALLDHRRATTLVGAVSLMRSDAKAELKSAEVANLVSQGVWKLANGQRAVAAAKMGIPEVRVRLADADVTHIKLNGHRVVNPIGFTAKAVELYCRETFVDRDVFAALEKMLTDDNLAGVGESSAMLAGFVARLHPQQDAIFVSAGARESVLYRLRQGTISFLDSVLWGTETLLDGVAKQFGVDAATAHSMLARYGRKEVSASMSAALERAASGELAILAHAISSHQSHDGAVPVYVHATVMLPAFLFDPAFSRRLGFQLSLTEVNERFIGKHTGFVVQWQQQRGQDQRTIDAFVNAIADFYSTSHTSILTAAAKRRARWASGGS